jgi:hypothetical protein
MRFRVTDERYWSHEFAAHTAAQLSRGITAGWDAYMDLFPPRFETDLVHPGLRARVRLAQIDRWLEERLQRDHTPAQESAWVGQAIKWRHDANSQYGGSHTVSPLRLHVFGVWDWYGIGRQFLAVPVQRSESNDRCERLVREARDVVLYAEQLDGFFDMVSKMLGDCSPPRGRPTHLSIVRDGAIHWRNDKKQF